MHYRGITFLPEGCLRMPETMLYAYSNLEWTLAKLAANVQGQSSMAMSVIKAGSSCWPPFLSEKFVACRLPMLSQVLQRKVTFRNFRKDGSALIIR